MATVHEMDHPLIKHKLALMRDKTPALRSSARLLLRLQC